MDRENNGAVSQRPRARFWQQASSPYIFAALGFLAIVTLRLVQPAWMIALTQNYLPVHVLLEFISILVSFGIFTVGWATYQNARDADILLLCIASLAVGTLDLGHTLSFTGMPDFVGPSGPNKAIDFWFASRITGSLTFLYLALFKPRVVRLPRIQWLLLAVCATWIASAFFVILYRPHWVPAFFIPGEGLLPLKVQIEWALVILSSLAGLMLFVSAERSENINVKWMGCASLLYGMSGYFFTIYHDFDDVYNFAGHIFKAISYLVLYRAVFIQCVSKPYERAQRLALEAEASSLSKSRFLANVSHELRTPLGVIAGFGDLLVESGKLHEPQLGWSQTIVRNTRQLRHLIDDLLDLAKAENEKVQLAYSRVDLASVSEQVLSAFAPVRNNRQPVKLTLENRLDGHNLMTTDELRLRQILMNIIGNAVKFTAQGEVRVDLSRRSRYVVEIAVIDSGIGIDEHDVDQLFSPFAQVSNPSRRNFSGTGLGLSLSRKLAELLGGSLVLRWSRPGRGSCFAITLTDFVDQPVTAKMPAGTEAPAGAPDLSGYNVLVAEDSEDNQILIETYLQPTNVSLTFAENGRRVLELTADRKFDCILMDIQMPEMDGFEATTELRKRGWDGHIIALTAHALQPERDRALQNGFDHYLVKPIRRETLWQSLAVCVRPLEPAPRDKN